MIYDDGMLAQNRVPSSGVQRRGRILSHGTCCGCGGWCKCTNVKEALASAIAAKRKPVQQQHSWNMDPTIAEHVAPRP